jgi:hypothetical protein
MAGSEGGARRTIPVMLKPDVGKKCRTLRNENPRSEGWRRVELERGIFFDQNVTCPMFRVCTSGRCNDVVENQVEARTAMAASYAGYRIL